MTCAPHFAVRGARAAFTAFTMRRSRELKAIALAVLLCTLAGALCAWLKTPLPWMVGPLAMMAFPRWRNWPVDAPLIFRDSGQLIIGTALGLYFTPQVMSQISRYLPFMLLAGFAALFTGYLSSLVLRRLYPGMDPRPRSIPACRAAPRKWQC